MLNELDWNLNFNFWSKFFYLVSDYREAFRLFDKDGDGNITTQELGNVMRSLGQYAMADELKQMLEEIDSDGKYVLFFEQFLEVFVTDFVCKI